MHDDGRGAPAAIRNETPRRAAGAGSNSTLQIELVNWQTGVVLQERRLLAPWYGNAGV
jgi:hypothetical protein